MAEKDAKTDVVEILKKAKLITKKNGDTSFESLIDGKERIGIYFSAHWCPPCRGFTPKLVEWYNTQNKETVEIIFASSDRAQEDFDGYYRDMPWAAVKFEDRDSKKTLSELYQVTGIPTLVFIKPDGTVETTDGRNKVMEEL